MMKQFIFFVLTLLLLVGFVAATDIVITPSNPTDDDDLIADVEGSSDSFDYYWIKDGLTYYSSTGKTSTLDASYTSHGETWTVSVWVPESGLFDSTEIGEETVTIAEDASVDINIDTNHAPYAKDISFTVTEGDTIDVDLVQYIGLLTYETADTTEVQDVPAYDSDGDSLSISYDSLLDNDGEWITTVSDAGVYTVVATVSDGVESVEAIITITVEAAEVVDTNTAPIASDIYLIVNEGDFVNINLHQYYGIYGLMNYVIASVYVDFFPSNEVPAYDADDDILSISYGSLLDINGEWQTVVGDAGNYIVIATVSDGIDSVDVSIDITVLCLDIDGNGVCDDDECPDADGDGICDDDECPDADGDGICDDDECPDADSDGICDDDECPDADGDGVCDDDECPDADGDGICDDDECPDADSDGICDDDEKTNTAPVLDNISDIELEEGETISICAEAYEAEGDILTYTYSNIPGGSYDASTGCWTWDTTYHDAGQYDDVIVTVSDGEYSDSTSFDVKVNDVCDDFNENDICDEDEVSTGDYEGDLLLVQEAIVLNANSLYSAYDVSDMSLETTGIFYVEDDTLYSTGSDDEIKVLLTLTNDNTFDTREITVSFIFNGKTYTSAFEDLDRSEEGSQVYVIPIVEGLESGNYPLVVQVESDDISYETAFNLHVVSLGDYIASGQTTEEPIQEESSFWEKVRAFFGSLF